MVNQIDDDDDDEEEEEAEEDRSDEQATAVENGTNSRDMATTPENETNSSSSIRRQRDVEKVLVDRQLIHGTTALHQALRNGHEEVARYLLKLDPEMATLVNGAGESPLFLAAESCSELFMQDLLQSERQYSTKGPDRLNVLHAAGDCFGKIISLLIRQNRGKAAIHQKQIIGFWFIKCWRPTIRLPSFPIMTVTPLSLEQRV